MFAVTRPFKLLNFFFEKKKDLQKIIGDHFKNFYVSLGTTTYYTYLPKSQRFESPVSLNVTEMVLLLS